MIYRYMTLLGFEISSPWELTLLWVAFAIGNAILLGLLFGVFEPGNCPTRAGRLFVIALILSGPLLLCVALVTLAALLAYTPIGMIRWVMRGE